MKQDPRSRKRQYLRYAILLAIVLALFPFAMEQRYPQAAPRHVQEEGLTLVRQTLIRLQKTPFGNTRRGLALIQEANRLIDRNRIFFSDALGGARGVAVNRILGPRRIYLRVMPLNNGKYLHQLDYQLAEALIHEAVHSLRTGLKSASFEEECDAFCAGLEAEDALKEAKPVLPLKLDSLPVAEFVRRNYPRIRTSPGYRPVEITREKLAEMAGF